MIEATETRRSRGRIWLFRILWLMLALLLVDFVLGWMPVRTAMPVQVGSATIALDRRPISFMFAEYDRDLVVLRDGKDIKRTRLMVDTGGSGRMNVYRLDDDTLIFVDRFDVKSVRMSDGAVQYIGDTKNVRPQGVFLGGFDTIREEGRRRIYRFVTAAERDENPVEPAKGG